jgi:hypothetical protein
MYLYIYYRRLQFLNNVVIIKTKVLLPQAYVTLADCCYPVQDVWSSAPTELIYELYKIYKICQNRHLVRTALVAVSVNVKVILKTGF